MANSPDGKSKGYGFVHFESNDSAAKAIDTVNGMLLADRKVFVGPFIKKTERPSDKDSKFTNVFFKNLGTDMDEKELTELAQQYGEITSAKVRASSGKKVRDSTAGPPSLIPARERSLPRCGGRAALRTHRLSGADPGDTSGCKYPD